MEAFFALLTLCAGNSPVTGEFPSQRASNADFDGSFNVGTHKLLNTRMTSDLRLHDVHVSSL